MILNRQTLSRHPTAVEVKGDGNRTKELALKVFQLNARGCSHGGDRTDIGAEDKWWQPGRSSFECHAEVKRRLLNQAIGQVSPKCGTDIACQIDDIGIRPDLSEVGCHSH